MHVDESSSGVKPPNPKNCTADCATSTSCSIRDALAISRRGDVLEFCAAGRDIILKPLDLNAGGVTLDGDVNDDGRPDVTFTRPAMDLDGMIVRSEENIIRGLNFSGFRKAIVLTGSRAYGNKIQGCYLGTTLDGTAPAPNRMAVVVETGAHDNIIGVDGDGRDDALERNVISGNETGVLVWGGATTKISGNIIGVSENGQSPLYNVTSVYIINKGAEGNIIGTDGDGQGDELEGNVIGAKTYGILLYTDAHRNRVAGNFLGYNAQGVAQLPPTPGVVPISIQISSGNENLIGTNADGVSDDIERNIITGGYAGIRITSGINNRVAGNYIGTDVTGRKPMGAGRGIILEGGSTGNLIGTDGDGVRDEAKRNVISGNFYGVQLQATSSRNTVAGNYVGTGPDGETNVGNGGNGIQIYLAGEGNVIGGEKPAQENLVRFNSKSGPGYFGIVVSGKSSSHTAILANRVYDNAGGTGKQVASYDSNAEKPPVITGTEGHQEGIMLRLKGVSGRQIAIYQDDDRDSICEAAKFLGNAIEDGNGLYHSVQKLVAGTSVAALVTGGTNGSNNSPLSACVSVADYPPVFEVPASLSVDEGALLTTTLQASDPNGDELVVLAAGLPPGAIFNPEDKTLTWTPDPSQSGIYPDISFSVSNAASQRPAVTKKLSITVGNAIADDDGDACNGVTVCEKGICKESRPAVQVPPDEACKSFNCDPKIGELQIVLKSDGSSCSDADVCNGEEVCRAGSCAKGEPPAVDDHNACTKDSCDPVRGVRHDAVLAPAAPDICHEQAGASCEPATGKWSFIQKPNLKELCDGKDNNCNGQSDEGFDLGAACEVGLGACKKSGQHVCKSDGLSTECNVKVGEPSKELCSDSLDNDCDGQINNGCQCSGSDTRPCGKGVGECSFGSQKCLDGLWEVTCLGEGQSAAEVCDGKDNNCDGKVDEVPECKSEEPEKTDKTDKKPDKIDPTDPSEQPDQDKKSPESLCTDGTNPKSGLCLLSSGDIACVGFDGKPLVLLKGFKATQKPVVFADGRVVFADADGHLTMADPVKGVSSVWTTEDFEKASTLSEFNTHEVTLSDRPDLKDVLEFKEGDGPADLYALNAEGLLQKLPGVDEVVSSPLTEIKSEHLFFNPAVCAWEKPLTPPCIPADEICDGKDNNCDGSVDENCSEVPSDELEDPTDPSDRSDPVDLSGKSPKPDVVEVAPPPPVAESVTDKNTSPAAPAAGCSLQRQ